MGRQPDKYVKGRDQERYIGVANFCLLFDDNYILALNIQILMKSAKKMAHQEVAMENTLTVCRCTLASLMYV